MALADFWTCILCCLLVREIVSGHRTVLSQVSLLVTNGVLQSLHVGHEVLDLTLEFEDVGDAWR